MPIAAGRRIVTGLDPDGKSIVIADEPRPLTGREAVLWQTDTNPASLGEPIFTVASPYTLEPAPGGTAIRYFRLPPKSEIDALSPEELEARAAQGFAVQNASHCRVDTSLHPGMHKTRTVDYVVVLSGQVSLVLERCTVDLHPFDVVIQRGANHAWVNRLDEPALLLGILVDAAWP